MLNIQKNIILSPYTTFKIGGPARFFCEVRDKKELAEAVKYAKDNKLVAFVMGGGSNILFSDAGFDGLVIRMISSSNNINKPAVKMRMQNGNYFIECWAGESLASIVKFAVGSSLSGLEWATGIPGTVGGAIRGNAGAYGSWMKDVVYNVEVMEGESQTTYQCENDKCDFEYRESVFKKNENLIIISAVLKLTKGNKEEIEERMKGIIKKRDDKIPKEPSPGSYFKNPQVDNTELIAAFENDMNTKCEGKRVPAPWLIEEAGLKGKKIGQAKVSEKHGNFVINSGGAKAQDVIMLASLIKQRVRDQFGIELKEEIKYAGF